MTTIRTKCPSCGDVDMAADEISLHLDASGDRGEYGFTCPECFSDVTKPANRKAVALLIAAGVEPAPLEETPVDEPVLAYEDLAPNADARTFTLDDVIAFHFLLEDENAVAELLSLDA
jgi:hypothetical protein